jgi:hypothetical protein
MGNMNPHSIPPRQPQKNHSPINKQIKIPLASTCIEQRNINKLYKRFIFCLES